jgi:hypothetical protein
VRKHVVLESRLLSPYAPATASACFSIPSVSTTIGYPISDASAVRRLGVDDCWACGDIVRT